jgi:hypothetical protein
MICARCHSDNISVVEIPHKGWIVTHKHCKECRCHYIIEDEIDLRPFKINKIIKQI